MKSTKTENRMSALKRHIERCFFSFEHGAVEHWKLADPTLDFLLTSADRRLIKASWTRIPGDKSEFGERVCTHAFLLKPNLLKLFPFAGKPLERLRDDPYFKRQAMTLTKFLDEIVFDVFENKGSQLRQVCWQAGKRSLTQSRLSFFSKEWWKLFRISLLDCIQPYCKSDRRALDAWARLMDDIIDTIDLASHHRNHKSYQSPSTSILYHHHKLSATATTDPSTPAQNQSNFRYTHSTQLGYITRRRQPPSVSSHSTTMMTQADSGDPSHLIDSGDGSGSSGCAMKMRLSKTYSAHEHIYLTNDWILEEPYDPIQTPPLSPTLTTIHSSITSPHYNHYEI